MAFGRILLLGVNGQVGHELRRCLLPLGRVVTAARSGAELAIDLARPDSVTAALDEQDPDLIVNAAAYTAVDQAETETELAYRVNGESVAMLAQWAARHDRPLIHYSTDYVFPGDGSRPYREDDAVDPVNAYGASKLAGENAIREADCRHLILRTAWVYGNRGRNFLRSILGHASRRDQLGVVDDQHGAPTWSRMLAQLTTCAIEHVGATDHWDEVSGTYHLSARGRTTWCEFARRFVAAADERGWLVAPRIDPITTDQFPTPARRPAWSVLDNSRFEQTFGLTVPDWETQLALCLEDFHTPHD